MAESILNRTGERAPVVDRGHGTRALGPSDSSDSGSDLIGPGLSRDDPLEFDHGTTSDPDFGPLSAGPDFGDADLDSDSDAAGTGERASAGRDTRYRDGADIAPDHIETFPFISASETDELSDEELAAIAEKDDGQDSEDDY